MKKTKIRYEDIKAGDLIEVVDKEHGVKMVYTGIVFEKVHVFGFDEWRTSQGGVVITSAEEDVSILRVDVSETKFEDIHEGDLVRVSFPPRGGMGGNWEMTHSRTAVAAALLDEDKGGLAAWVTRDFQHLISRSDTHAVIEILERDE